MKRLVFFFMFFSLALAFVPHAVSAINLNLNYPAFGGFDLNDNQKLHEIVAFFYYFIVGIAGLAAFVMLVWGGVQWLMSGAIPSQASEARDKIKNAILGLLLVLASFLVIQVINPELTILGIGNPGEVGQGESPLSKADLGIYLCENENCEGKYVYIDPSISGCKTIPDFTNINLATCDPKKRSTFGSNNFNDKTSAVKFDPKAWNVVLFEDIEAGGWGHALCLKGSYFKLSELQATIISRIGVSWNDRTSAMQIVKTGSLATSCATNGITLPNENFAPPSVVPGMTPPVVFFFNKTDFGSNSFGSWAIGLPLNVWAPGFGAPFPALGDWYDVTPPRSAAVHSIWVARSFCGLTGWGIPPGVKDSDFDCAVFVSDTIDPVIDPKLSTHICFTHANSPRDTREKDPVDPKKYKYSFKCDGGEPITTKVNKVEVHAAGFCPDPGVVQNCSP